jgi:integrase
VTRSGKALSRDALEHRLAKYVQMAGGVCPTLMQKSMTMHVLRHSAAMRLLHAGIDTSVSATASPARSSSWSRAASTSRLPRSTCMPIWPSRSAHWLERGQPRLSPADSGPPTNFSPFWRRSDYAAFFTAISAFQAGLAALIGIIRSAA